MKKLIIILLAMCGLLIRGAGQNLTAAEYFIDTDPGMGNGTSVSIGSPAANLVNIAFNANITSATLGFHRLYLRTKDANGTWSHSNSLLFYKTSNSNTPAPNITAAEYFIDTDPGFGAATAVAVTAATNITGKQFDAAIGAVSTGFHRIYLRTKDADGRWSLTNTTLFYKTGTEIGPLQNIVAAEYFIDTDPGFGAGKPIAVTPGTNIVSSQFNADIAATTMGFHRLLIRTKDAAGHWSLTNNLILYKKGNAPDTLQFITAAEYFIDADPGIGNANPIAIHEVKDLGNKQLYMNVTGLAAGEHRFYLRTKDMAGVWSLTNNEVFTLGAMSATPALIVNSISRSVLCARDSFSLACHVTGSYVNGNIFTVYLSNSSGSFAAETAIGNVAATGNTLIKCKLPSRVPDGSGYKLRIKSSNPSLTGAASITSLTLYDRPDWKDTTIYIVCQGEKVNLLPAFNTAGFTVQWNTPTPGDVGAGVYRITSINANGCTDTAYATVKQDIGIWMGTTSNNWHTATNWSNGHIPTEKTHVIVPPGAINPCVLGNSNGIAASLQIRPGGTMQVINSRQVVITAKCTPLPTGP